MTLDFFIIVNSIMEGGIMKKSILVILTFAFFLTAKSDNAFRFAVLGDRTGTPQDPVFEEIIDEQPDIRCSTYRLCQSFCLRTI